MNMNNPDHKKARSMTVPELTLRDMLTPLFRHRRVVIAVFCGVFLLAILFAWLWASNYYVASMQVVVEQDRSDPAVTSAPNAVVANKPVTTDQINSEVALLQGNDMLRSVAGSCGLANSWSIGDVFGSQPTPGKQAQKLEHATIRLGKKLQVEEEKLSDVINVKYGKLGDPETPACVLQNLSKLYLAKHLQLQRPAGSTDFFTHQVEESAKRLGEAEMRLANFGRDEGVAAPEALLAPMAQHVAGSVADLYQTQQTIAADEQRIKSLEKQMAGVPARSSTTEVSNSATVLLQQLQANLLEAQIKRTQLLLKYDPAYPLVRESDQEIGEIQSAIAKAQDMKYVNQSTDRDATYEFLRLDVAKTQADLASQKATAAALVNSVRSMRTEMANLDAKAVKQSELLREVKADEGSYLLYLNKREQERTSDALDLKRIANVAIAVPPVIPVLPAHSPLLVGFVGFFLAIFTSIAAGFVAEYIDPSFRTPAEVADILGFPVLASVPRQVA
jgi:uncharacterized protein involved in exopolysaccharide biosynthesis